MNRIPVYIFFLFIWNLSLQAQDIPHPVNNTGIYEFLDELANNQIISVNSTVKPYSRMLISKLLKEADEQREKLNSRQQKELDFYMKDFGKEKENGSTVRWFGGTPVQRADGAMVRRFGGSMVRMRRDLFYYKDSLFSLTVNPILGYELFTNSSGEATYLRNGLEARAYVGKWGFYASLRDNHEKPLLGLPEYLSQRTGGHLKGSTDWSEMKGGVTYSWNWGNAGFVKDDMEWGSNYHGANIFGGNNPSYIQLRLQLNPVKWFSFNWFHGRLNSMVVDSSLSYWVTNSYGTNYREIYHKKFISANMFTFTPFEYFNISAGNSIVYDNPTINPAFLVPVFFYKSVDHSVSSGIDNMNSQMFLDISSRQIRHLHLYASMFIDELSVSRITRDDEWNFFSYKAGFRISDLPVNNLSFTSEFTYTYPLTFMHYVPTLTFESNNYNLGHYLKDNSREWYLELDYRPVRTLDIRIWFANAVRGPDYSELGGSRLGNPPLDTIIWRNTSFGVKGSYQVINDLYVWGSYIYSDISGDVRWGPGYFQGIANTLNAGVTFGF